MLAGRDLHVTLDSVEVLRGVCIEARPGEVLGLIGPNGAGKSTLLHALAGIVDVDSGSIEFDGKDIATLSARSRARHIAFLPQSNEVYWPVTVANLVALGRLPHRKLFSRIAATDEQAIQRAVEKAELQALSERSLGSLSGGERMRALVARMLAVEADVLLADEPVAGLDPHYQIQFMDLFAAEAGLGRSVVLVLHDLALASRYCDRLVLLHEGRVAAAGPPETVLTQERIEQVYRVVSLRARHEGKLYVLPWRQL